MLGRVKISTLCVAVTEVVSGDETTVKSMNKTAASYTVSMQMAGFKALLHTYVRTGCLLVPYMDGSHLLRYLEDNRAVYDILFVVLLESLSVLQ